MRWTVVPVGGWTVCGMCGRRIGSDQPYAELTYAKKKRCVDCVGGDVDWQEVDNERFRIAKEREASDRPAPPRETPPRFARTRPPVPVSHLADTLFDHTHDQKARAAGGERDE